MIFLSGFTLSALLVIIALYCIAALPLFLIELFIINQTSFGKKLKEKSVGVYWGFLALLFLLNVMVVFLIIYAYFINTGKGLLQS